MQVARWSYAAQYSLHSIYYNFRINSRCSLITDFNFEVQI